MNRREFVTSSVALAGGAVIAGCSGVDSTQSGGGDSGGNSDSSEQPQTEDPTEGRPSGTRWYDSETEIGVMEGVEAEVDSIGSMYIRGTAKNFGDVDYDYVQLTFEVYDETDAKIADGLANTNGLSSGQRWRFEALAPSAEDAASYALTGVRAF